MTVSKTTNACHSYGTTTLRGGRLIKWKGQVASLSPSLGQLVASVSPVALGRGLMVGASKTATAAVLGSAGLIVTTSGASAACTPGNLGVYTCSGAMGNGDGDLNTTTTTNLLDVTVSPSTTFNVTNGDAFDLDSSAGITFTNKYSEVTIAGAVDGINAYHDGTYGGALSITTTGTTTGNGTSNSNSGIYAKNKGTDLTINAATTTGGVYGIIADNGGTGALSITTTGTTTGGVDGIQAANSGTGALGIKTTGTTTGTSGNGIDAYDDNTGSVSITTTGTTTGGTSGIRAINYGGGALSITTTGTTTGETGKGISASNLQYYDYARGTSLTINATDTTGETQGIFADNDGTGALEITTTGTTTGSSSHGIYANNSTAGTSLKITAEDTTGTDGIYAANEGGALEITTTGTTTGTSTDGIFAANFAAGTSLTISAATTTGAARGIAAINSGTGALEITTTGATTGTSSDGIIALNLAAGTSLTIIAATTTGASNGIYAYNSGTGALSITTTGAITGGTGYGIHTQTAAGKTTNITLNSGAVSSTAGLGIFNNGGNSTTTVNSGASVAGKIVLGDGVDSLNFAGGDFSGVTLFDGGAGTSDILKFSGSSGSVNSTLFSNWETVEINDGSTIAFSNSALTAGTLSINTGGTLNAVTGTFAMTGNLSNAGMIAMADAATGDKVTVSGNFTGGGQIKLDVDTKAKTSDQLAIAGNSSGTSQISFTNLTPGEETGATINDVVTVAGTSSATDFSGSLVGGIYTYNLTYDAGDFDLIGALNSTSSTYRVTPVILDGFNQITSLHQRTNQRQIESMSDAPMLSFLQGDFIAQQQPNIWLDIGWSRSELQTTSGTDIKNTNRDITVGIDVDLDADANGSWVLGGSVQYGTQSASVSDALGTGSAKTKGNGFGVTATWYGSAGTYVDMQGQVMRLESKISSSAGGLLIEDASSRTNAISMEVGHRIVLAQNEALIPQVQLTRGKVDGASFTDTGGTVVDLGSNETRTGRVGIAYEYVSDDTEFYGIGSILRDFGSASEMAAGNLSLLADTRETWGEIGVGGSYIMDEQTNLFGEVSYRQALNNSDMKAISVNAGIQINW
ncbi:autotransporter outer membrane beta-barrel domain-containing protein [Paracoccaceae bacterium]|nr:autotransporter outer membrane beta-barrel domain-containing protein [Paracoccaceae bacterium]